MSVLLVYDLVRTAKVHTHSRFPGVFLNISVGSFQNKILNMKKCKQIDNFGLMMTLGGSEDLEVLCSLSLT